MDASDKKARSEALRLESLKRKREEEKKRTALVSSGLKAVDKPAANKVVFEDSESSEDEQPQGSTTEQPYSKKPKLFDDDEDEDDEEEIDLKLPSRLEGKKGAKLMKMEAQFGDARFKMSDRFASSDSESEDEPEKDELSSEKQKNRELLAKVLGKTVKPTTSSKSSSGIPSRPFTRYDPDNEEHVNWMKLYGNADKTGSKEDESAGAESGKAEGEEKDGQRVVDGNYFEIDTAFADELRAKVNSGMAESSGFSFLAMMGRKRDGEPKREPLGKEEDIRQLDKKTLKILGKSEEESTIPEYEPSGSKPTLHAGKFFLTGKEAHVKSVVANFRMTQSIEKTVGLWSNYRDSMMKIYRKQKKTARKQMREKPQFNGKLRRQFKPKVQQSEA